MIATYEVKKKRKDQVIRKNCISSDIFWINNFCIITYVCVCVCVFFIYLIIM